MFRGGALTDYIGVDVFRPPGSDILRESEGEEEQGRSEDGDEDVEVHCFLGEREEFSGLVDWFVG